MTDWPGRQGAPEPEQTASRKDRQIARARNQRGVVPMRLTHAPGKQSDPMLGRSKSQLRD